MKFDLVIVAGGSGNRAGGDKLKFLLRDSTVLERTIDAFLRIPNIERIIVVLRQEDVAWGEEIKEKLCDNRITFAIGGDSRPASVMYECAIYVRARSVVH